MGNVEKGIAIRIDIGAILESNCRIGDKVRVQSDGRT